ncbi:MAG: TonB-dependent receptor [Bdellovibrionales bacterium]|nr:TonB-dependent receptor [Bdellovibrionales bacterium]NQZ18522.1 TonB-dependent receptor [Bdellovibrionales bacterium]
MTKIIILISLVFSTSAWAQTADDVVDLTNQEEITINESGVEKTEEEKKAERELAEIKSEEKQQARIEKIEVTGSYIRRIDTEGPSPIVVIDQQSFEDAGIDTVSDYLREDPLFNGSEDSGNRDGYFQFRGQHGGSTLVLLNGIRIPKLGGPGRGFFTSVQNIPTSVIDRVEILKDGSSATYGSDAQAGVINFITKRDYDGAEFNTRVNVPELGVGLQQNHNIAFGKNFAGGNWFATVQYTEQQGYTQADIGNEFLNGDSRPFGTNGNINVGKDKNFFQATCDNGSTGRDCRNEDRTAQTYVRDPNESLSALLSTSMDIGSDMNVAFVGMYNRRNRQDIGRASPIIFNRANQNTLTASQIGNLTLKGQASDNTPVEARIFANDEIGLADVNVLQNAYTTQAKIEGFIGDTWSWNLSGGYAFTREERNHRNGLVDQDLVAFELAQGYNPASLGQNNGALDSARIQGVEAYESSMTQARLVTSGELFEFTDVWGTGGPMSIAMGVEAQYETTNDDHDDNLIIRDLNEPILENQFGNRRVTSAFVELVSYPLNNLEVQMAGRYDEYSDFGSTFNPKLAVGFRPNNKVLLRSSIGTSFTAPSVRNMIQRDTFGVDDFEFETPDNPTGEERELDVTRYRDPNLKEEVAVNYNFGTIIQPNRNWSFGFDQWNFEGKDTIGAMPAAAYENIFDAGGEQALNDAGAFLVTDGDGNTTGIILPAVTNRGSLTIRGIDLNANFNSKVRLLGRVLTFRASSRHSQTIVRESRITNDTPAFSFADIEWKNTTSLSLNTRDHFYRLAARSLAGDSDENFNSDVHTEYDFTYRYKIFRDASFSVGVKNLVNRRPPTDRTGNRLNFAGARDRYAFQPLGRRYFVGYRQAF